MRTAAAGAQLAHKRRPGPAGPAAAGAAARALAWLLAMVLAAAVALAGCSRPPDPTRPRVPGAQVEGETISFPKDSPQLGTLRLVSAEPERDSFVRINGRTSWDESRTSRISSPVSGRVLSVHVQAGSRVTRGDLLALVSSPEFGIAQADARKAEAEHEHASRALRRARELFDAGVIPAKELQAAEADERRSAAERDRAGARERAYGAGKVIDQRFRLVSPIAGVVVERRVTVGQEVRAEQGGEAPLFVVSDPAHLWITLDVPEALVREVQVGESVRISLPALPDERFWAQIEYVADMLDPQARTIKARAALANPLRRLKAEMYVAADVEVPASSSLRVPATALFLQGDRWYAFVEEAPGRFARRALRAEAMPLGFMRVLEGLKGDERVVADGALLLQQILNQRATAPRKGAEAGGAPSPGRS